jgi:N6-adenosine-specific RNA methylase IME4
LNKNKVVYIDPPWEYKGNVLETTTGNSLVQNKYKTMNERELINFPINDFADSDCYLFMWSTVPKLDFALKLLSSWGFVYKSCVIWKKEYNKRGGKGLGTYFMIQTEILLFAIRGKVKQFHSGESNYITAEWRGHSVKPDVFRKMIERVTNNLQPRIEIFARINPIGWNVFGNDSRLQNKSLEVFSQ